jgi:hypothetical protein
MVIRSLSDLQAPDDRTLHSSPLGLGGRMGPEDSAEFQQHVVARHELVPAVAEGTRQSFDQLREIFAYGVLCYDIFTLINDNALQVLEQALRDRFIDFHGGTVTFVHPKNGETEQVPAERYEQVHDFISRHRGWKLRVGDGPQAMRFNGMLGGLRAWAPELGFLRGQRNKAVEAAITRLRNHVAHPSSFHLTTPVDAANTISDLAEIINHLWGHPPPAADCTQRRYPRTIIHVSWKEETGEVMSGLAALSPESPGRDSPEGGEDEEDVPVAAVDESDDGWTVVVVRGVLYGWDLMRFDARFAVRPPGVSVIHGARSSCCRSGRRRLGRNGGPARAEPRCRCRRRW